MKATKKAAMMQAIVDGMSVGPEVRAALQKSVDGIAAQQAETKSVKVRCFMCQKWLRPTEQNECPCGCGEIFCDRCLPDERFDELDEDECKTCERPQSECVCE